MRSLAVAAAIALVLILTAALYLTRLSVVPAYLMHDEVNFSLQAHAIATTGRDTNGRLLPVYFSETGFEAGRDPAMIYWTAAFLRFQPLSETAVRLPTALLAVISVALMFLLARQWLQSDLLALIAATFLTLTPGYFTNARLALSITYAVPIVILWLICMQRAVATAERRWSFAAGTCLGAGVYTYLASVIVMPLLALASVLVLFRKSSTSHLTALVAGFALLLVPLAAWSIVHPDRFTSLAVAYQPSDLTTMAGIRERVTAYWMFFNPDYLFISGDGRMTNSTRAAGLLPMAFAILIPVGLYRLLRAGEPIGALVIAGLLLSPLPMAISGHLELNRVLCAIPFGVLAAAAGMRSLLAAGGAVRLAGVLLGLSVILQFSGFHQHYLGDYRMASAPWFGGDNRAAVLTVLDRLEPATPAVYLDAGTPIERYWRFYALARGRKDQLERPTYFNSDQFDFNAAAGSLLVCEFPRVSCRPLESDRRWQLLASATLPDGAVTHSVYIRNP